MTTDRLYSNWTQYASMNNVVILQFKRKTRCVLDITKGRWGGSDKRSDHQTQTLKQAKMAELKATGVSPIVYFCTKYWAFRVHRCVDCKIFNILQLDWWHDRSSALTSACDHSLTNALLATVAHLKSSSISNLVAYACFSLDKLSTLKFCNSLQSNGN